MRRAPQLVAITRMNRLEHTRPMQCHSGLQRMLLPGGYITNQTGGKTEVETIFEVTKLFRVLLSASASLCTLIATSPM